ncbi:hypothetical protein BGZ76_007817, partial [Entomortierella beljakovae]
MYRNAAGDDLNLAIQVQVCLQEVTRLAAETKRSCQVLLGRFIELILTPGKDGKTIFDEKDRKYLDAICPRLKAGVTESSHDMVEEENLMQDQDLPEDKDDKSFLGILMRCLYAEKLPLKSEKSEGQTVTDFIKRLQDLKLLGPTINGGSINKKMPYPGTSILGSVTTQLATELKRIYKIGSQELSEK